MHNIEQEHDRFEGGLKALYEFSNALRVTLDLDHILHIILTCVTAHTGLGFNRAIVFLVDQKHRVLEPKLAIGPDSPEHAQEVWSYINSNREDLDDLIQKERNYANVKNCRLFQKIKNISIPLIPTEKSHQENSLVKAFFEGTAIHVRQDNIQQYSEDPLLRILNTHEAVIVPLKTKDRVNGIIVADNPYLQRNITQQDIQLLSMLANQAGLAIENSELYELMKSQVHTDSVTGLWNHGFFQAQLKKELSAAVENKAPLSLVMMDIDNFKKLNDTYGHQFGDYILKETAQILRNSFRDGDFVCRYGGEEFTVILTETSKQQAFTITERIREEINQHVFSSPFQPVNINISVSIGIANFPEDTTLCEDLIYKSDQAMYRAKRNGKNQTYLA